MPPLLCLSPVILDQSFPRTEVELRNVGIALGDIQEIVETTDSVHVALTDAIASFIEFFEWGHPLCPYDQLEQIHRLMVQWLLQPSERIVWFKCSATTERYPVPCTNSEGDLLDFWAEDMAVLARAHEAKTGGREAFIGIACPYLFARTVAVHPCRYLQSEEGGFPIVGPDTYESSLADAYEWVLPHDLHQKLVTIRSAKANIGAIGGTIRRSSATHYEVTFPGGRTWPLDVNTDPLPPRFIKELEESTGLPDDVIKFALLEGELPLQRLKIAVEL